MPERKLSKGETLLLYREIQRDVSFRVFAGLLDRRVRRGRWSEALRIMKSVGVDPGDAWAALESWSSGAPSFARGLDYGGRVATQFAALLPEGVDVGDGLWGDRIAALKNLDLRPSEE